MKLHLCIILSNWYPGTKFPIGLPRLSKFRQEWVMKPCEASAIFEWLEHVSDRDVYGCLLRRDESVMLHRCSVARCGGLFSLIRRSPKPWKAPVGLDKNSLSHGVMKVSKSRQEVRKSIDRYDSRKSFNLLQNILDVWMLRSLGGSLSDALRTHPRGWSRVGLRLSLF